MQFKILTFVSLCGLALAAPQALVTRNTPAASSGSAVVADSSGNTRIFTQGGDGSILLLSGSGVNTGSNYKSSTVVGPNIARTGTPIAVVSPNNALAQIRLYFIGTDNKLKEYIYASSNDAWTPGGLINVGYGTYPGSQVLYATVDSRLQSRVGFVRTENILSEAYDSDQGASRGWRFTDY